MSKHCGACGMSIPDNALRCPHCTTYINWRGVPRDVENQPVGQWQWWVIAFIIFCVVWSNIF